MDLIMLLLAICLVGFVEYLLTTQIPMPPVWVTMIRVIAFVVLLLWVLQRFTSLPNVMR